MNRLHSIVTLALAAAMTLVPPARGQEDAETPEAAEAESKVSFLKDVAPILVENCIGCHNPKKAESRYDMTTFASLAKGGAMGEGIMFEAGDPDLSYFVELIRPDGVPRMPFESDPLPDDKRMLIERWVAEGASFDGEDPGASWLAIVNRAREVVIPDAYPYPMPITALAFAPDGGHVVASGYHELNTYAIADGTLVRRSRGVSERVYDLAFSPDGTRVATAAGDPGVSGEATLWAVREDGTLADPRRLVESDDAVFCVAFSPDGTRLAVGGADRAIRVFDVESGERTAEVEDHADWVLDLAFSPDGTRLASASRDKTSKLFDASSSFESLLTFPGHAEAVYCVAFAPDGKTVLSGGGDARVRRWDPGQDAKQVRDYEGFDGPVFDLALVDEGRTLAACGSDATVRLFDLDEGKQREALGGHGDWVYCLAVSPDGKALASGCWDGEVRVWDVADGALRSTVLAVPGHRPAPDGDASRADAR